MLEGCTGGQAGGDAVTAAGGREGVCLQWTAPAGDRQVACLCRCSWQGAGGNMAGDIGGMSS